MENEEKNGRLFTAGIILLYISLLTISTTTTTAGDKAQWMEKYGETREFVKLKWSEGMNYNLVKEMIKKDQLPLLYQLMADPGYAEYWHNIARIIGYISDDPNSIDVLLIYFQRDDISLVDSLTGKDYCLAMIGKIGGQKADSILKKAITKEGVQELAKLWINKEEWKKGRDKRDKEQVIAYIQGAAIDGLVNTGKKENWDIVEKLYNDPNQAELRSKLVEAMAKKALIADNKNDVEAFFRIDTQVMYRNLKPYLDKYSLR